MWCTGDRLLKRYVVAMPDLQEQQLSSQDDALILASDGLWDVLANQDAAQLIKDIKVGAADTFHGSLDSMLSMHLDCNVQNRHTQDLDHLLLSHVPDTT